jgi:hypothetical protein
MDSGRKSRSLRVEKAGTQLIWETNCGEAPGWRTAVTLDWAELMSQSMC